MASTMTMAPILLAGWRVDLPLTTAPIHRAIGGASFPDSITGFITAETTQKAPTGAHTRDDACDAFSNGISPG